MTERATELITTLKSMLPEGLDAIVIKDSTATGCQVAVRFCYQGMEDTLWLGCTHASFDKMECGSAISTAMVHFAEQLRDRDMEAYWRKSCYPPVGK